MVETALREFGRIDAWLNNAAIPQPLKLEDTDAETNRLDLPDPPARRVPRHACRLRTDEAGWRRIVWLYLLCRRIAGHLDPVHLTETKWAVRGMSKSAAFKRLFGSVGGLTV